jgi:DNA-binding IclR family transcriptional regulator
MAPPPKDRDHVTALMRGIEILAAFTPDDVWLGNAELAARVGLPKPTVSRITQTLTSLGYLRLSSRRRQYRLGVAVLTLGYAVTADSNLRRSARPLMQHLADRFDVLVALGARDAQDIIHIESCHSARSIVSLRLEPGTRGRIAETAFGRALLAALPKNEFDHVMAGLEQRYAARWAPIKAAVAQAMADIATRGFCTIHGSWQPDINAVGVPLRLSPDQPVLSLGLAGFARQMSPKRLREEIGPCLVELAHAIENLAMG